MARKTSLGSLLLAGAAAYGLYKVSKMSAAERNGLVEKGKKLVTDNLGNLKNTLGGNSGSSPDARVNSYSGDVTYGG
jgi:hypothetical protein